MKETSAFFRNNDAVNYQCPVEVRGGEPIDCEFGTSGYRGKIAEDFTFETVMVISQVICDYLNEKYQSNFPSKKIVIGYDTRFLSEEFAKRSASVFCANGFSVIFADDFTPTPVISIKILEEKALGAINITASHNPYNYNGIKFSPAWGGPALPEDTEVITAKSNELLKSPRYRVTDLNDAKKGGLFMENDLIGFYSDLVKTKLDSKLIAGYGKNIHVFVDVLHGTSKGIVSGILSGLGITHEEINIERDAFFRPGFSPNPTAKNLKKMSDMIKEFRQKNVDGKISIGLSMDGDADRYGVLDEDGDFIEPNIIFPLLYNYYVEGKGIKGDVARSVATTAMVDRVARFHGFKALETPVGFKYLGKLISEKRAVMAGEESAGLTVIGHTPDKDGIFTCLLVLEMLAFYKKPLKLLVKELMDKFGPIYSDRINVPIDKAKFQSEIEGKMVNFPDTFEGKKIIGKNTTDGYKIFFEDDSWLLARLSGTEELMRIYGESDTADTLERLMASFKDYLI